MKYRLRQIYIYIYAREEDDARASASPETERGIVSRKIERPRVGIGGTLLAVSRSSTAIIHAATVGAINEAPGFMRAPVAAIAARRGRGIRLIILIAPSTPFLCAHGKCVARTFAYTYARARCLRRAVRLTLYHSKLFTLYSRSRRSRVSGSHKTTGMSIVRPEIYAPRYDAKNFFSANRELDVRGIERDLSR